MNGKQSKLIFVAQDAHGIVSTLRQPRPGEQIVDGSIGQVKDFRMKID
jgi:hypothetical protein